MRNIKLSIKLPALVVIAIAVTTVANGLVALAVSQAVFRPLVLQNNRDNAGAYASALDQYLRTARVLLETVSTVSPLPGPVTNPEDGVLSDAHALATGMLENSSAFDYVMLLRADGSIAAAQPASFASEVETERVRSERALILRAQDWFRTVISTGQTAVSDLHTSPVTQRPSVVVAAPMRDERGQVVALWVGGLNLGELHHLGKQAADDQADDQALPWYGYVVDSNGTLVAHQADEASADVRIDLSVLPAMQQALAGQRGESEFTSPVAGEEKLVTYMPLKETRWAAVWMVPAQVAFGQLNRMALLMGGVSLLLAVLLGTLAVGATRRVARSLQQLTENARRIGAGDFTASDLDTPPAGPEGDELQILVGEFGKMAGALREKEAQLRQRAEQLEREVAERQRAEEALSRESRVNAAVAEVSRAIIATPTAPIDELVATILAHAKRLTHSALGFVAYLDPQTGRASCASISEGRPDQDRSLGEQLMFEQLNNERGRTLNQGRPLRINDSTSDPCFMSAPPGHTPIRNFLSIPALIGGSLVGQIALANADHPYTDDDVNAVEPLASLYAVALQRQRAEDTLRASERKFRSMVEQSIDGIVMTDERGIIIEWNRAEEQITGVAHAEAMGKPLWEAQSLGFMSGQKPSQIQEQSASSMRAFFTAGEAPWLNQLHELELHLPEGGSRYIETVVFAIPGERGVMAGSITRDVTARWWRIRPI